MIIHDQSDVSILHTLASNPEYPLVLKYLKCKLFTRLSETDDLQMLGKVELYEQWP